jgi:hypothetical protein
MVARTKQTSAAVPASSKRQRTPSQRSERLPLGPGIDRSELDREGDDHDMNQQSPTCFGPTRAVPIGGLYVNQTATL